MGRTTSMRVLGVACTAVLEHLLRCLCKRTLKEAPDGCRHNTAISSPIGSHATQLRWSAYV